VLEILSINHSRVNGLLHGSAIFGMGALDNKFQGWLRRSINSKILEVWSDQMISPLTIFHPKLQYAHLCASIKYISLAGRAAHSAFGPRSLFAIHRGIAGDFLLLFSVPRSQAQRQRYNGKQK